MPIREFAFDVKLNAVVRVKASSEKRAREWMDEILDCVEPGDSPTLPASVKVTEFSLSGSHPNLFEIDGKKAASKHNCDHRETGGGICLDCGYDTVKDD